MLLHRVPGLIWIGVLTATLGCGEDRTTMLIEQLGEGDVEARRAAARELGNIGSDAHQAVAALHEAVGDTDTDVRRLSIYALGQMGPTAMPSLSTLTEALNDRQISVRLAAAIAMQKIDPSSEAYVPVLVDAMRRGEGGIILEVGRMEPTATWAVPTLVALISHQRPIIRAAAATALGQVGSGVPEAEAALKRAAQDPDEGVRQAAAKTIRTERLMTEK